MDLRTVTRCWLCGGETARGVVTAENWWGETVSLVEGVPADVCGQCGEPYFDAATCRVLDELRRKPPAARRMIEVPVYSYTAAA